VAQQAFLMGETAMRLLIEQLESKHPKTTFQKILIPTLVELRASI
jgi:DNA-binding LacI/PurR family transcriptional regulator